MNSHAKVDGGSAAGVGDKLVSLEIRDSGDWAWEFLRRNPQYRSEWRAAVPRRLTPVTLADGTRLLRLRRRYPQAERWGLHAFADPFASSRRSPVYWLPTLTRRVVRARCVPLDGRSASPKMRLADFNADRAAVIDVDGVSVLTLKGADSFVMLTIHGLPALASPASVVFELEDLDDLTGHTDCLRTLHRFLLPAEQQKAPFGNDDRLRHALIALDGAMTGKTYRQIATVIFGEEQVAREWSGESQFMKDRTRRLVAKGRELMQGGYRDLLG